MRQLIKQREIVTDQWRYVEEDPLGRGRALILPVGRWLEERDQWWLWDGYLGVRIAPDFDVSTLARDFSRLALIAIEFGGLGEGRGYSQAQILRRRLRYVGELRAVGSIQRDQLLFLARSGFDAFELPEGTDLEAALAAFEQFSVAYQPAVDVGVSLRTRFAAGPA